MSELYDKKGNLEERERHENGNLVKKMSDKKSKTVKKDDKEKQQDLFVFDPKEKELKIKEIKKLKKIKEELIDQATFVVARKRQIQIHQKLLKEQNFANRKHKEQETE